MILLDTNIISELMRPEPAPVVEQWLQSVGDRPVGTTTITISEIAYGLDRLPTGQRKQSLWNQFDMLTGMESGLPIFAFEHEAALLCGLYRAKRENSGAHAHASDMMIAGIAGMNEATLATRNSKDFSGLPIEIVNPWNG